MGKQYLEQGSTQFEASVATPNSDKQALIARVDALENQVSDLTKRLEELEQLLD